MKYKARCAKTWAGELIEHAGRWKSIFDNTIARWSRPGIIALATPRLSVTDRSFGTKTFFCRFLCEKLPVGSSVDCAGDYVAVRLTCPALSFLSLLFVFSSFFFRRWESLPWVPGVHLVAARETIWLGKHCARGMNVWTCCLLRDRLVTYRTPVENLLRTEQHEICVVLRSCRFSSRLPTQTVRID